ncbi:hypothetical protein L596_001912 [Steinernema carpocapsae]|uniref:Uncharacterized protein n=1 Tax=Steinernema carpocapsae TaxID=34508 RepID=A0A4U8UMZ0_STECR|nr:hypothetical protein L596_001912 [Steinernema carpocapsae]
MFLLLLRPRSGFGLFRSFMEDVINPNVTTFSALLYVCTSGNSFCGLFPIRAATAALGGSETRTAALASS